MNKLIRLLLPLTVGCVIYAVSLSLLSDYKERLECEEATAATCYRVQYWLPMPGEGW